jgi:lysosomal acid lipase/cholesteryl ester hydrolase
MIENAGYKAEVHQTETADGYKLKVHRILPKRVSMSSKLGPVLLMHGLFATAADFLVTGADNALRMMFRKCGLFDSASLVILIM